MLGCYLAIPSLVSSPFSISLPIAGTFPILYSSSHRWYLLHSPFLFPSLAPSPFSIPLHIAGTFSILHSSSHRWHLLYSLFLFTSLAPSPFSIPLQTAGTFSILHFSSHRWHLPHSLFLFTSLAPSPFSIPLHTAGTFSILLSSPHRWHLLHSPFLFTSLASPPSNCFHRTLHHPAPAINLSFKITSTLLTYFWLVPWHRSKFAKAENYSIDDSLLSAHPGLHKWAQLCIRQPTWYMAYSARTVGRTRD